ncbi:MAG: isoleucine--tRNA ligase [bacterium]|nr:isoleucine--tRNA ligase [bacterium]
MSTPPKEANPIKESVNLPQTDFPIRAGLINLEPELLEQWQESNLAEAISTKQSQATKRWILHDGPPYPNGNIHMGHALNKILKDIIVRTKTMQGYASPYRPGWDCHGLPIEIQLLKQLQKEKNTELKADIPAFRNRCKEFALNYVETQKDDFKRLGINATWNTPYLTLDPHYEAEVIRCFGKMADNGLIYKGRKPIHWCMHCETALAEAEIEYDEHRSPSITVAFPIKTKSDALTRVIGDQNTHFLVWTTTPWTLPANVALAANSEYDYVAFNCEKGTFIAVKELVEKITEDAELGPITIIGSVKGAQLIGSVAHHPFIERESPVLNADFVTNEDGTGFVHIAPGHGQDDYFLGLEHQLPIIMPVDDKGHFTKDVPAWEGQQVFEANKAIGMHLEEAGKLIKLKFIKHSYPHCWRCKNPVIFRATEQWFVGMDRKMTHTGNTLREDALQAIKDTKWYPDWGEKRIRSMVEGRPDWCISRQRSWGIPIPAITCTGCGESLTGGKTNEHIAQFVRKHGTTAWFESDVTDIVPGASCPSCSGTAFKKESDILDVWFESGASFMGVLETDPAMTNPAAMYLEGSDQHRGWFQSSLLIGIGAMGKAPFESVLTHGFIVDEKGQKMSKSQGNVIAPEKVVKQYGADILRWWCAGTDFKNDVAISDNILNQARDSFGKVRNTIRFMLSNLADFEFETEAVLPSELTPIDAWILTQFNALLGKCNTHIANFDFHQLVHNVHDFCAVTLSGQYLDVVKDRLYCDSKKGLSRRSTQTTIYQMADALIRLVSPILVFTAEDAYRHFNSNNKETSIHLTALPTQIPNAQINQTDWSHFAEIKGAVYQELEAMRKNKEIKSFLEVKVTITTPTPPNIGNIAELLIVSQANVIKGNSVSYNIEKLPDEKCERCWRFLPTTQNLCTRCAPEVTPV